MNQSRLRGQLPLLLALLLAGFALRLFQLDAQSIWWDEGISLHLASSPWMEILSNRLDNIHPPLYFMALKLWVALVGDSPFAARYSSVLASWFQIAVVWGYVQSIGVRRGGNGGYVAAGWLTWLAGGLVTISAVSVIYGQETRVYAFLPLVYLGLLWAAEQVVVDDNDDWRVLLFLAALLWVGVHLHYIALLAAGYVGLWGTLGLVRRRAWSRLGRWFAAFALAGLASLPWFVAVLSNWLAVQAEASAGTFATEAVPVGYLVAQVWAFQLTGLAGSLGSQAARALALAAAVSLGLLLVFRLIAARPDNTGRQENRSPTAPSTGALIRQLAHWVVPLAAAFLLWSLRSFSHPRYTIMFVIALSPLVAVLLYPTGRHWFGKLTSGALLGSFVALSVWGVGRYFFDANATKADMRAVARHLEVEATAGDLILIPDTDWSLPFEYEGDVDIVMATLGASPATLPEPLADALACPPSEDGALCDPRRTVFVVDYERGTRDWQDRLPFELERRGTLVSSTPIDELRVDRYLLTQDGAPLPVCNAAEPPLARFENLLLHGAWLEQTANADSALTAALCWSVTGPADDRLIGSILVDDPPSDRLLAQRDTLLLDGDGRPSDQWAVGEPVVTYHVIPFPVGLPPLQVDISAGFYALDEAGTPRPLEQQDAAGAPAGQIARLGSVTLMPGSPAVDNPYQQPVPPAFPSPVPVGELLLSGAAVPYGSLQSGKRMAVDLIWAAPEQALLNDLRPVLALMQDGVVLAENTEAPLQGRYPTTAWVPGELVSEVRLLRVPSGASGKAEVVISLARESVRLGRVELLEGDANFEAPLLAYPLSIRFGGEATLVGFDLPSLNHVGSGPLPLTLVWRADRGEIPTGYVVFAHLLDETGRLIAQHDGPPDDGRRPATEWLMGEFITDERRLVFREAAYSGPAYIEVGLYDPATGLRLPQAEGGDAFRLPVQLTVDTTGGGN